MAVSFIVLRQENMLYQQLYIVKQHWREQQTVLGRTLGGHAVHHLPPSSSDYMKPYHHANFLWFLFERCLVPVSHSTYRFFFYALAAFLEKLVQIKLILPLEIRGERNRTQPAKGR